jgi:hypothetical protein
MGCTQDLRDLQDKARTKALWFRSFGVLFIADLNEDGRREGKGNVCPQMDADARRWGAGGETMAGLAGVLPLGRGGGPPDFGAERLFHPIVRRRARPLSVNFFLSRKTFHHGFH